MNSHIDQLVQIANPIKQAYVDDANGLTRLHLSMTIALLQQLSTDIIQCMFGLQSVGEQSHEVLKFAHISNIHLNILDL